MILHAFQDLQLSALGFGAMRLPVLANGEIDAAELDRMVDAAIATLMQVRKVRNRHWKVTIPLSERELVPGRQISGPSKCARHYAS